METDAWEASVRERARALKGRLRDIEDASIRHRLAWLDRRMPSVEERRRASLGQITDLFYLEYLGCPRENVPVVSESDDEIVVDSLNPCETLDACGMLGLDTRRVCRRAHEKPVQAFLSSFDPAIRFVRSYERIRPHAEACRERFVRVDLEGFMGEALEQARISRQGGEKGFGAVVVRGTEVMARAHDAVGSTGDPSCHAEMLALREAARIDGPDLTGCLLVSTCEPCPMCSAMAVWANLTSIVYGVSIERSAGRGKDRIRVGAAEIVQRSPAWVEVLGGIRADECEAALG